MHPTKYALYEIIDSMFLPLVKKLLKKRRGTEKKIPLFGIEFIPENMEIILLFPPKKYVNLPLRKKILYMPLHIHTHRH